MPIHEYECRHCRRQFEFLVLPSTAAPSCPLCGGHDLERRISAFAVNSEELSRARVRKARAAHQQSKDFKDKQIADAEEAQHSHDD
jgi:putative FmdB family regulatory protein